MGVDAGLFTKKSKKYFWFDRESNIRAYWNLEYGQEWKRLENVYDRLINSKDGVEAKDLLPFLQTNLECWQHATPDQQYHGNWIVKLIAFVKANPDERFFVFTDHMAEWPEFLDGYEQVQF